MFCVLVGKMHVSAIGGDEVGEYDEVFGYFDTEEKAAAYIKDNQFEEHEGFIFAEVIPFTFVNQEK